MWNSRKLSDLLSSVILILCHVVIYRWCCWTPDVTQATEVFKTFPLFDNHVNWVKTELQEWSPRDDFQLLFMKCWEFFFSYCFHQKMIPCSSNHLQEDKEFFWSMHPRMAMLALYSNYQLSVVHDETEELYSFASSG